MNKILFFSVISTLLITLLGCTFSSNKIYANDEKVEVETKEIILVEIDTPNIKIKDTFSLENHFRDYKSFRSEIMVKRGYFNLKWNNSKTDSLRNEILIQCQNYLIETFDSKMFNYWFGTEWDFNGITETPRKGEIACGYFISTLLKHSGFKVERYKLAQQSAEMIIRSVCNNENIETLNSVESLDKYMSKKPYGIYVLGLDYHVGFVLKNNQGVYFVHSDYFNNKVVKEKFDESAALNATRIFMIGDLFSNKTILKNWVLNQEIKTRYQ